MGFSFSRIHRELASERFRRFFLKLREEFPLLRPFSDPDSLIAFFHDKSADMDRKDKILFDLIILYQKGSSDLGPFFLALFTPALASIYSHGKRKCPFIKQEDLIQDICLSLLEIISSEITPYKVAGQIVGKLKNRIRMLLDKEKSFEFSRDDLSEKIEAIEDDHEEGLSDIPDVGALLDRLVRIGEITKMDRKIIIKTVLKGKSLNDFASTSKEYERLKKRRRRMINFIQKYLANNMKSFEK